MTTAKVFGNKASKSYLSTYHSQIYSANPYYGPTVCLTLMAYIPINGERRKCLL